MKTYRKRDFPVAHIRRILEPGPIVLVSSCYKGETDIMTMGWHMVMEFTPSLVGCIIAASNHSFDLIRKSKQCVINVPTADMANVVVGIGNCSGDDGIDKFRKFGLSPVKAAKVKAPLIAECFASFECVLHDARLIGRYNMFVFEVVKAHVAPAPKFPKTLHYHGQGIFTSPGARVNLAKKFTHKEYLY
jgi:flavin reductase (DIM6/NTAB) family NADH-FMN oxidoreductase RutF